MFPENYFFIDKNKFKDPFFIKKLENYVTILMNDVLKKN